MLLYIKELFNLNTITMKRKEIAIAIVYFVLGIGVCILGNMTMDAYDNTIEDARYQGYNQGYDDGWQIGFEKGLE